MKKFKYYGREVEVPDYATHIAVERDGQCWWFTRKPNANSGYIWLMSDSSGTCGRVGYFDNVDNWKGSLRSC